MRWMPKFGLFAVTGFALLLAACSGSGPKLMGKSLPDETQVIDGPTLALPPQFELRPPRESADYESVLRAQKGVEAQNLIVTGSSATTVGASAAVSGGVPASDDWLLQKTAVQNGVATDPDVRSELAVKVPDADAIAAKKKAQAKKGLFARWFGGSSEDDE